MGSKNKTGTFFQFYQIFDFGSYYKLGAPLNKSEQISPYILVKKGKQSQNIQDCFLVNGTYYTFLNKQRIYMNIVLFAIFIFRLIFFKCIFNKIEFLINKLSNEKSLFKFFEFQYLYLIFVLYFLKY